MTPFKSIEDIDSMPMDDFKKVIIPALQEADKMLIELSRMKSGSYALINQITTISKQRIYDPKYTRDILSGIRLSTDNLDLINDKIKKMYIK